MNIKVKISMKEKKLGGRPKLASYQKRTKCFRVMFTETTTFISNPKRNRLECLSMNFAIRRQWIVKSVNASVLKWYRLFVTFPVSPIMSIRLLTRCTLLAWKQSNNNASQSYQKSVELSLK